jgi:hypothetical protein
MEPLEVLLDCWWIFADCLRRLCAVVAASLTVKERGSDTRFGMRRHQAERCCTARGSIQHLE